MGRLDGKTALVTGASRGIGREIALELAQEGAKVALNYQSSDARAQELADEIAKLGATCMLAKANVADPKEARDMVKRVVEQFGRLDVLVNNAGITRDKSLRKMTDDDWLEVVQTNLNAVFFCTSAATPVMIEQNYGRIINISSMNGQTGAFGQANYGASKGGIIAFTKTAALELARFNITVNAICPGFTLTDMLAKVPTNIQDQIKARIPLGRFGTPADMAKAVTFLVEGGDYITGQTININGGAYM
ncbi:MAG TPA: 3-oxoacyl-ACP reductase family protein [Kouleothrix sp.]|uniref:3-oxoacyl-ACP reductase family protein n=1 Tax=Kouleothrix sp. TaxID=2779161 RepID=UPI002CC9775E|nr:3-oxoacyl-ACP reductase family protein [Kouleothrix sp.]HRC77154.1 3-oxoacyl-ACP reductase family protein [Kouleothrix sp.]